MSDTNVTSQRRTLVIVFFTVFIDLLGFGLIIPIQPFVAETMGASPTLVTWLGGIFSLMTFLWAPLWGRLSDRIGRRPVMLISIAIGGIGYLTFATAHSLGMLFFARALSGIGSGNLGAAQAIIADSTPPERRAKGMGLIGAAFGLGFLFGPAIGGYLGQWGLAAPAYAAAILCGLNWISALVQLPETYPAEKRAAGLSHGHAHRLISLGALREAVQFPNVARIFTISFLYTTSFSMIEQVLSLFIERVWLGAEMAAGTSAKPAALMTGQLLMLVGITATIVQGGLIGRLTARFGERRLLATGVFLVAVSLVNVVLAGHLGRFGLLLANAVFMATGTGLLNPSAMGLLSRSVPGDRQGSVLGLGQSFAALGRVIGPAASGWLFSQAIDLPFELGAGLLVVCLGVALSLGVTSTGTSDRDPYRLRT